MKGKEAINHLRLQFRHASRRCSGQGAFLYSNIIILLVTHLMDRILTLFTEKRNLGRHTIFEFVALDYSAID